MLRHLAPLIALLAVSCGGIDPVTGEKIPGFVDHVIVFFGGVAEGAVKTAAAGGWTWPEIVIGSIMGGVSAVTAGVAGKKAIDKRKAAKATTPPTTSPEANHDGQG